MSDFVNYHQPGCKNHQSFTIKWLRESRTLCNDCFANPTFDGNRSEIQRIRSRPQRAIEGVIPSFAYPGGKARLRKHILTLLPPEGQRYVEPFAGGGNVFFAVATKLKYRNFWLNDLQTCPFFIGLLMSWRYAIPDWRDPQWSKRMYARVKDRTRLLQPAPLLEPYLTFSGGSYGQAGRRNPCSSCGGVSQAGFEKNVRTAFQIMKYTQPRLTRLDYKAVLAECGRDDVVYLDPRSPLSRFE
jgi:D12 class N6 adenine-specific DNA methyltransferase